jgi:hypothetical protein
MDTKDLSNEQMVMYFAEHIRYEIQQLIISTDAISRQLSIRNGFQNMVVESFAIHLRNLITFLYPSNRRGNDVCAEDFFTSTDTWHALRPEISEALKQAKARADKEVGHLTTLRQYGTPESKVWNVASLIDGVMPILKLFCERADKVKLHEDFEPVWNQYVYTKNLRTVK